MKTITKSLLVSSALVLSPQTLANDNFTFGMGAGTFYSGVGWVKTDIFDFQTPKHGASLYIGVETVFSKKEILQARYVCLWFGGN